MIYSELIVIFIVTCGVFTVTPGKKNFIFRGFQEIGSIFERPIKMLLEILVPFRIPNFKVFL